MIPTINVTTSEELRRTVVECITRDGSYTSLNHIDVSSLEDLDGVFENVEYHGDMSLWNTSRIKSLESTFRNATISSDISKWSTCGVIRMLHCFREASIHADISNWSLPNLENIGFAFYGARFKQPYLKWSLPKLALASEALHNSNLNVQHWTLPHNSPASIEGPGPHSLFPRVSFDLLAEYRTFIAEFYLCCTSHDREWLSTLREMPIGYHHAVVKMLKPSLDVHPEWEEEHTRTLELAKQFASNLPEVIALFENAAKNLQLDKKKKDTEINTLESILPV